MSRWPPDARGRLVRAAVELFGKHGFDNTTAAQIAERAGLTERTFFRHFSDKREVLFSGQVEKLILDTLAGIPGEMAPLPAVAAALCAPADYFDQHPEVVRQRHAVIAAHRSLRERELIKLETLAVDLAAALVGRGLAPAAAELTARAGVAVFQSSFARWIAEQDAEFTALVHDAIAELRAAFTTGPHATGPHD